MDMVLQKQGIRKNIMRVSNELVQRSKEGDLDSFNQLVERYQGQVYNLTLRMLGTTQDAEYTTREAFILAWKAIRSFRGNSFRAWLFGIAFDGCTNLLRSKRKCKADSLDALFPKHSLFPSLAESPEGCAVQEKSSQLVSRALLCLSEEQRLVVILADLQGLSYEEIAQATHRSLGAIESILSRGRANLRDLLFNRV